MNEARKQDTRRKIEAGGLIVKAGLAEETAAVLLGLLLEASDALQASDAEAVRQRWTARGKAAFAAGLAPETNSRETEPLNAAKSLDE